jgi:hypothetical protein
LKGVVLLGVPRSGTTLLRRLFDGHPSFSCPPETMLLTASARFLAEEPAANGLDVGVLNGLAWAGFAPELVVERLRTFAFGFFEEHARRAGKSRWAEKTALDAFHLPEIDLLCGGEVHFVALLRHPLDTACSMLELIGKMERWPAELHPYVIRNPRMARLGETWPAGLEQAALEREGAGMGDWKGGTTRGIDAASVGRHRSLSRITVQELGVIVGATARRAGYEPPTDGPRPTREAARRIVDLAIQLQRRRGGGG